ncbi:MAG: triose-phosphate isomerase [Proteobacteria bacterium]|nr:triose-phosphate isomerase [Pseudomonadota bacterium]
MRGRLVAGNWKMHGSRATNPALLDAVLAGVAGLAGVECAVCVPFPYLSEASARLAGSKLALGAQTLSEFRSGAYTGEVSAAMLADFGCRFVLVGHSERRGLFGETDAQVAAKFAAAAKAGLTPVLCVGETLAEREGARTEQVVARQLDAVLDLSGAAALAGAVLAYEPVWAIGTGRTASPQQAQDVHAFLRARVAERDAGVAAKLRILYGGSVKPGNAAEIFAMKDVDGGLIGGASLVSEDFLAICKAAVSKG